MSSKSRARASHPEFDPRPGIPVCGIDEVGRGPLAGPVMAACVLIPERNAGLDFWSAVTDSKKLSAKKRQALAVLIKTHSIWGLGEACPAEIDMLNIHHATLLAMKRAFHAMLCPPAQSAGNDQSAKAPGLHGEGMMALVDGKFTPELPCPGQAVIKGDSKHVQIAAASILAKVTRDGIMAGLHRQTPHYGWDKNAGYGTAQHLAAIRAHGITPHHRMSFAPCREATER